MQRKRGDSNWTNLTCHHQKHQTTYDSQKYKKEIDIDDDNENDSDHDENNRTPLPGIF